MANVFTPDNTRPTPPALGNTGEVGGNGSAPVTLQGQCSMVAPCGPSSGCTAGGGPTGGGGTGTGTGTGGTMGGGGGTAAGGGPVIHYSPFGGPGGGGLSPPPSGVIHWMPLNAPIGPAPLPGPIMQGGGGGCGCGGAGGVGGGGGGGLGGGSPISGGGGSGSGPGWTLKGGGGGAGGGFGGIIFSPMNGPLGPITGPGPVGPGPGPYPVGPGGPGTTGSCTPATSCPAPGSGGGNGTAPAPGQPPGPISGPPPIHHGGGSPPSFTPFGAGQAALQRAASMPAIGRSGALPPLTFGIGACNSLGGQCVINPANPSVAMQIAPPAGDLFYIRPVLSYSTTNSTTSELGAHWRTPSSDRSRWQRTR